MSTQSSLPPEIFELLYALYPAVSQPFKRHKLSLVEFLLLSRIKHNGRKVELYGKEQIGVLRSSLNGFLNLSDPAVTNCITRLEDERLVVRMRISQKEKEAVFGKDGGPKNVVVIREQAVEKINQLHNELDCLFRKVAGDIPAEMLMFYINLVTQNAKKAHGKRSVSH